MKDEGRPPHGRGAVLGDACICDNKTSVAGMPRAHLVRGLRRASRGTSHPVERVDTPSVELGTDGVPAGDTGVLGVGVGTGGAVVGTGAGVVGSGTGVVTVGDGTGSWGWGAVPVGVGCTPGRVVGSTAFVDFFGFLASWPSSRPWRRAAWRRPWRSPDHRSRPGTPRRPSRRGRAGEEEHPLGHGGDVLPRPVVGEDRAERRSPLPDRSRPSRQR